MMFIKALMVVLISLAQAPERSLGIAAAAVTRGTCPDLASQRSVEVQKAFNPMRLADPSSSRNGGWFEHRYIDPAQILARCQRLSVSPDAVDVATGAFNVSFSVLYLDNEIPFSMLELYEPVSDLRQSPARLPTRSERREGAQVFQRGLYLKHVDFPFGNLVHIPTVIVDAFVWNSTSAGVNLGAKDDTLYDALIMSGCLDLLDELPIRELIFATRSPSPQPELLAEMEKRARSLGVVWTPGELESNDWKTCPLPGVARLRM